MVRSRELLRTLTEHEVDFVIVGGLAAVLHGSPLGTFDVDVCMDFSAESLTTLLDALRPLNPRLRHRPDRMPLPVDPGRLRGVKNLYLLTDLGAIDLLGELPGVGGFGEIRHRSVEMDVGGFGCRLLDLDTLIAQKRVANREKDRRALPYLLAIRASREGREEPVRGTTPAPRSLPATGFGGERRPGTVGPRPPRRQLLSPGPRWRPRRGSARRGCRRGCCSSPRPSRRGPRRSSPRRRRTR